MADHLNDLRRLGDALCDNLAELSDDEILELARRQGISRETARQVQGQADSVISAHRRSTLIEARNKLDKSVRQGVSSPDVVDLNVMRMRLQAATEEGKGRLGNITLAARDGKGVPDADIADLYWDAVSLGFIKEDGDEA